MLRPPDRLPHVRWRRLPGTAPRRSAPPNMGGPGVPLRGNRVGHAETLAHQAEQAIHSALQARQAAGIDPTRLFVLRMTFLQVEERGYLERLGLHVVDEQE